MYTTPTVASDRIIYWKNKKKPTRKEVQRVIEDYFSDVLTKCEWSQDRFFLNLVGQNTHPLRRMPGTTDIVRLAPEPGWEGRHIEVVIGQGNLDVLTRRQDEFTMRAADGLAAVFARFWEGTLEE